jgi:tetratricopeptide (TPR) repeat protein
VRASRPSAALVVSAAAWALGLHLGSLALAAEGARRVPLRGAARAPASPAADPASTSPAPRAETPAAREQARQCEETDGEEAIESCRRALGLGLSPARAEAIRQVLAARLAGLERWPELIALYREGTERRPADAAAWRQLGTALLLAGDEAVEAVAALERAAELASGDPGARIALGVALNSLGRHEEALRAFETALGLDAQALDAQPAAAAAFEASKRGERWP